MARIIVAGAAEAVSHLLTGAGLPVYRACATGDEVRRALNDMGDGVVIIAGKLPDGSVDSLYWDICDTAQVMVIGRPAFLETCEAQGLFRLEAPCPGGAIIGAAQMLLQLHGMSLPHRSGEARTAVERAKKYLMDTEGLTEPEAHRRLQKYAMDHGLKLVDYAHRINEYALTHEPGRL